MSRDSSTNRDAQRLGEPAAQRRLAGAAQADQRDAPPRRRPAAASPNKRHQRVPRRLQLVFRAAVEQVVDQQSLGRIVRGIADDVRERAVQRGRHLPQHQDRRIAHAGFEIGEMPFGHAGAGAPAPCGSGRGARAACVRARPVAAGTGRARRRRRGADRCAAADAARLPGARHGTSECHRHAL